MRDLRVGWAEAGTSGRGKFDELTLSLSGSLAEPESTADWDGIVTLDQRDSVSVDSVEQVSLTAGARQTLGD